MIQLGIICVVLGAVLWYIGMAFLGGLLALAGVLMLILPPLIAASRGSRL